MSSCRQCPPASSEGDTHQLPHHPLPDAVPRPCLHLLYNKTKWGWQRQTNRPWEGHHGEVLRKREWKVLDKVQMTIARAPSDGGLIIFSVDEGLLSGSGTWKASHWSPGEGGGLPLPTLWGQTLSNSKQFVMLEVLCQLSEVAWCSLGAWATALLWLRLPGSLSICRTETPKLGK